jgi:Glyoxalase-like domain
MPSTRSPLPSSTYDCSAGPSFDVKVLERGTRQPTVGPCCVPPGELKVEVQWEAHYRPPVWPSVKGEQLMMAHLDIGVGDLDTGVRWALARGARVADHQPQTDVRVMLDPEGHLFCLFLDDTLPDDALDA